MQQIQKMLIVILFRFQNSHFTVMYIEIYLCVYRHEAFFISLTFCHYVRRRHMKAHDPPNIRTVISPQRNNKPKNLKRNIIF